MPFHYEAEKREAEFFLNEVTGKLLLALHDK